MDTLWAVGLALGIVLLLVGVFWGIGHVLARAGGWSSLARRYPARAGVAPAWTLRWRSGQVGWVRYNNGLTVTVGPEGLGLSCPLPFTDRQWLGGHPPLLIPWAAIVRVSDERNFWGFWTVTCWIDVGQGRHITVLVYSYALAEAIRGSEHLKDIQPPKPYA